ncbi:hypothetical protein RIEGSTA812A_PEG_113 [invertebrate metagenome]|uniref:Sigma-54 factor interaction domain-containing protein n=1 Tax=invertebrate metagenome TaxID=1711999 RepID=A0A484H5L6_9ZZZZ
MGAQTELIGLSPSIVQIRQAIERVAPTGSRVLITGHVGCGQEVVAHLLHLRLGSLRRDQLPRYAS